MDVVHIPEKIRNQISKGFDELNDAYTLRCRRKSAASAPNSKLLDLTAFECYVNEIGLNSEDHPLHPILGIEILTFLLQDWAKLNNGLIMRAIISTGSEFTHLNFHVVRPNETYLDDDLESYDHPIMIWDSNESINNLSDLKLNIITPFRITGKL